MISVTIGFLNRSWAFSFEAMAVASCSGVWKKIAERYCVPTSGPWRFSCRGIVVGPEDFQQLFVRYFRRVVLYLYHLGVPGVASAHVAVARILRVSAGVPGDRIGNAIHLQELRLDTPETSRRESSLLHLLTLHSLPTKRV